ncbi:methyl-accepting chemotaxis protein [Erwinia sp. MYb416]|uniref:methyl-accepting chemotaxis protein n=1 Tax=Erwinia sp. MYb416 TaxID=3108532 RepID=UPI0030994691
MSEEDKPNFRNFIRNVVSLDSNDVHLFTCRLRTADRRSEWFIIRAKYYPQEVLSRITGTLENISEGVEQANRFDVVSTRFDLSREMLNDGLWDLDIMNGDPMEPRNVFWWSPQFRNLLGYETVEEFPDVMDSWSSRLHPDDKQNALESFVRHLLDRSGKTGFDIEYRLKLRNGEYRWFQARGQTRRAADGTPLRAVGALIDIQNRKDRLAHEKKEERRLAQTGETANEIGKLVAENGDIAAQIKLISLNASIEAARAGSHGRGFSVIASEIRSLAERTADITGQISRLQMRIKNSADEAGDR